MGRLIVFTERDNIMCKIKTPGYVEELRCSGEDLIRPDLMNHAIKKIFDECRISAAPVDVKDIARQMGFDIYYGTFGNAKLSGVMWDTKEPQLFDGKESKRCILVNSEDSEETQRFTIAHEIGHFIMHCDDSSNFYERRHSDPNDINPKLKKHEDNADFFAANLVLPSNLIVTYAMNNKWRGRKEIINQICTMFCVDVETVSRRFNELGLVI